MAVYRPTPAAREALADWAAVAALPSPWPGWHLTDAPLALAMPMGAGVFVARHPEPGEAAAPVEEGPWSGPLGEIRWLAGSPAAPSGPAAYSVALNGRATVFAVPGGGPAALGPVLWAEGFRLFLRRRLGREEPRLGAPYPVDDPVVSALADVEGGLLRDGGPAVAAALVRRERRAGLEDEIVDYERAMEVAAGLPAYVGARVGAALGVPPAPPELNLEQLGSLPPRRRLEASGAALAQLLDQVAAGWKERLAKAPRLTLDDCLETALSFDGGPADDATLAGAQAAYGYTDLLAAAHRRVEEAATGRRALVESILSGPGSLLALDVSALGPAEVEATEPGEAVHEHLIVYRGDVSFRFASAEVAFGAVPVAQDLRAGLLQARVPGRLKAAGDGQALESGEAAEFTEGLQLHLHGVRVRGRRGSLRPVQGGLLISLQP